MSSAYRYYSDVMSAIATLKSDKYSELSVRVGIGTSTNSFGSRTDVYISRDLVGRMLAHALARAKAEIDALCGVAE